MSSTASVRALARGWRRGSLKWYISTASVLAGSVTLLLLVSGLFAGMQAETEERVADFFTGDVRVQTAGSGAIPPGEFSHLDATVRVLERDGSVAVAHLESQAVLSQRGFIDAALNEDEQFQLDAPGTENDGDEVIALGVLIGIDMNQSAARAPYEKHLVSGSLPEPTNGDGSVPVVMSLDRLATFLSAADRADLSGWPPRIDEVAHIDFEITAAVVKQQGNDVIRRPAHIAGLFDSGVDVLDAFAMVAPIQDVRTLLGHGAEDPVANVVVVHTTDEQRIHTISANNGWSSQSSNQFTQRYLGQLIDVLQGLSILMTIFLFMLPAFLVTHGVTRQLETHNREIAVCHAIGVRPSIVRRALGLVVVQMVAVAVVVAGLVTLVLGLILHATLPGRRDLPLPMDFLPTGLAIGLALGVTIGSVAVALWIAFRSQGRTPLAESLRTF